MKIAFDFDPEKMQALLEDAHRDARYTPALAEAQKAIIICHDTNTSQERCAGEELPYQTRIHNSATTPTSVIDGVGVAKHNLESAHSLEPPKAVPTDEEDESHIMTEGAANTIFAKGLTWAVRRAVNQLRLLVALISENKMVDIADNIPIMLVSHSRGSIIARLLTKYATEMLEKDIADHQEFFTDQDRANEVARKIRLLHCDIDPVSTPPLQNVSGQDEVRVPTVVFRAGSKTASTLRPQELKIIPGSNGHIWQVVVPNTNHNSITCDEFVMSALSAISHPFLEPTSIQATASEQHYQHLHAGAKVTAGTRLCISDKRVRLFQNEIAEFDGPQPQTRPYSEGRPFSTSMHHTASFIEKMVLKIAERVFGPECVTSKSAPDTHREPLAEDAAAAASAAGGDRQPSRRGGDRPRTSMFPPARTYPISAAAGEAAARGDEQSAEPPYQIPAGDGHSL